MLQKRDDLSFLNHFLLLAEDFNFNVDILREKIPKIENPSMRNEEVQNG
jgi:hypothetical protein